MAIVLQHYSITGQNILKGGKIVSELENNTIGSGKPEQTHGDSSENLDSGGKPSQSTTVESMGNEWENSIASRFTYRSEKLDKTVKECKEEVYLLMELLKNKPPQPINDENDGEE